MKISVKNYGPIKRADSVKLRPLTVFVGPSNTGKSYLAILIYALCKVFVMQKRIVPSLLEDSATAEAVKKLFQKKGGNIKFSDLPKRIQRQCEKKASNLVSDAFHRQVSVYLGLSSKNHLLTDGDFSLSIVDDEGDPYCIKPPGQNSSIQFPQSLPMPFIDGAALMDIYAQFGEMPDMLAESSLPTDTQRQTKAAFENYAYFNAFYLPAARTGIMQSHQAITGGLVQSATRAGLEANSPPALSGVVGDFLQGLINIDPGSAPDKQIYKIAERMEKNILRGSITVDMTTHYPRFMYQANGLEIPLLRASSMVSELAPIVLFAKHRVDKGDLLIIEEPEAHLHPAAQVEMAKAIARFVRAGVKVLVTTHSENFLRTLANCIRQSKVGAMGADASLDEGDVGLYRFKQSKAGSVVKKLSFDKESGLSPEDHQSAYTNLYNATADLLESMDELEVQQ